LIVGVAIATWLVPAYGAMWEGMTLEFNLFKDSELIFFLLGLLVFTALIAGAYPSIYISSYQPVNILRGSMKVGSSKKLSYSLLTAQYAFTVVALFASIAFSRNAVYQRSMDLGFDRQTILYTRVSEPNEAKLLKSALRNNPKVLSVGISGEHIGMWTYSRTLSQQEFELEADMMSFGENYFETMNVKLLKGRLFNKQNEEYDKQNSIIVNEKLVSEFGWQEPLGQRLSVNDSTKLTVVGVVKNFYYNGFWREIAPMGIRTANDDNLRFVVAKTNLTDVKEIRNFMESEMLAIAPDKPFNGDYQDQLLKESKSVNDNIVIIFSFLGILAIILSAIGLFTLVSLDVHKRTKEIGIRKVLGASIPTLIHLINKHFLIMLSIASVLGTLAAYFTIDGLIASIFTYYKEIDAITVILPILVIFAISIFISSSRIFGSAKQNPVESLRYE
jgi:putative ABC transport system permease protein